MYKSLNPKATPAPIPKKMDAMAMTFGVMPIFAARRAQA